MIAAAPPGATAVVLAATALAFLATFSPGPAASAAFLAGVAALAVAARRASPLLPIVAVLVAGAFQNLLAAALTAVLSPAGVLALLGAKEVFALVAGATGLALLRGRLGTLAADRAALLYGAALLLPSLPALADGSLASLASLRQALVLPALWIVGRACALDPGEADRLVRVILRLGLVMAAFGLLERFVLGDAFWTWIGLPDVYRAKGLERFLFAGLPENFYSWDPGVRVRRVVGTLGEPTSFAHFLALPVAIAAGAGLAGARAPAVITAAALLLTLGKSGAGTAFLGVAAGRWRGGRAGRLAVAGVGLAGLAGAAIAFAVSPQLRDNVEAHTGWLGHALSSTPALTGAGFGTAGNFATAMRGDALFDRPVPVESFVGALLAQAGLLGLAAYFAFGAACVAALLARREAGAPPRVRAAVAGVLLGTVLFSLTSETPSGFLAGGVAFLVAGAMAAAPRTA